MMRFYKMGNYSYDKKRILRIQRQPRELIIPLALNWNWKATAARWASLPNDDRGVNLIGAAIILLWEWRNERGAGRGGSDSGDRNEIK